MESHTRQTKYQAETTNMKEKLAIYFTTVNVKCNTVI